MRILHTSDWHLGQNFYSKSRADEHAAFLDWLLARAGTRGGCHYRRWRYF